MMRASGNSCRMAMVDFAAAHVGQTQIHERHVGFVLAKERQRFRSATRRATNSRSGSVDRMAAIPLRTRS